MKRRHFLLAALIGLIATPSFAANKMDGGLMIMDPWIREAPPGSAALAGFMTVKNTGNSDRVLVGASSKAFGSAMLHRTIMQNGMAKMVHQKSIKIAAGKSVIFKPGDYHIMLMQPRQTLKAGDRVDVTLKFANGEQRTVTFHVRKGKVGMKMNMKMDHGSMPGM